VSVIKFCSGFEDLNVGVKQKDIKKPAWAGSKFSLE
jgi:hypothetical protein